MFRWMGLFTVASLLALAGCLGSGDGGDDGGNTIDSAPLTPGVYQGDVSVTTTTFGPSGQDSEVTTRTATISIGADGLPLNQQGQTLEIGDEFFYGSAGGQYTRRVSGLSVSGESLNVDYSVTGPVAGAAGSGTGRLVLTMNSSTSLLFQLSENAQSGSTHVNIGAGAVLPQDTGS